MRVYDISKITREKKKAKRQARRPRVGSSQKAGLRQTTGRGVSSPCLFSCGLPPPPPRIVHTRVCVRVASCMGGREGTTLIGCPEAVRTHTSPPLCASLSCRSSHFSFPFSIFPLEEARGRGKDKGENIAVCEKRAEEEGPIVSQDQDEG